MSVEHELSNLRRRGGFLLVPGSGLESLRVAVGGYDRILLHEARRSATRSLLAFNEDDAAGEAGATAAAILCAAASCEARASEYLAHREFTLGELSDELKRVRQNWDGLEQWRLLLQQEAREFGVGESREYLALGCLVRVRNLVAHRNARLLPLDSFPDGLDDCIRQGTLPAREASGVDWTSVIFVHEVAQWAYDSAFNWLKLADKVVPYRG